MAQQQRGFHTLRRPHVKQRTSVSTQRRNLYIKQSQSFDLLRARNIPVRETTESPGFFLGITVDRVSHSPCVIASPTADPEKNLVATRKFPFEYGTEEFSSTSPELMAIAKHIGIAESAQASLSVLVEELVDLFMVKEAFSLETNVAVTPEDSLVVKGARFGFDDAAYKSSKRHEDIHKLRNKAEEVPEEVEAEKDGIVYVTYV